MAAEALDGLLQALSRQALVLVQVAAVQGSAPREVGAWMAVGAGQLWGSVGGGQLEFEAMALARQLLANPGEPCLTRRFALGPSLGQCCGGVVSLSFERLAPLAASEALPAQRLRQRLSPAAASLLPVALFGAGHVGRAIVAQLALLPSRVLWLDSREQAFPPALPAHVRAEHSEPVQGAVPGLAPQTRVLIMSHSHGEDLSIVAACLLRLRQQDDLPFVGLIGSRSKWASFRQRLLARGFAEAELARVTCPLGLAGIRGKQPALIALAVAAQLLQTWSPDAERGPAIRGHNHSYPR